MTSTPSLILASASPRRQELLAQIGLACRVQPVDIDESPRTGEAPEEYVSRLARDKARTAWVRRAACDDLPVLGSDTTVVLDGRMLGKPADGAEAERMLEGLSGRTHEVLTAVAVVRDEQEAVALSRSRVSFRPTTCAERAAYVASGEPQDKAGAYAIQGLGAVFVERLEGSYSGVMGLPLYETARLLADFGIVVPATFPDTDEVA
ncbi:MAG: Maf family protein [Acidihalobacter sp.]|jgi:septum formation protein